MSFPLDGAVPPTGTEPAAGPSTHTHTHPHSRDAELRTLYDAFQRLVEASSSHEREPKYIPPQIPVTCRGETRMFGRKTLAGMHYSKAIKLLRKRFQREGDVTRAPGKYDPEMLYDYFPRIRLVATFIGATTRAQRAGVIDESSWTELLRNIESIEVIFIPGTDSESMGAPGPSTSGL